jgi:hypothetical protein
MTSVRKLSITTLGLGEDLACLTDGELSNSRVIAGALAGYVQWCERLNRRFPFYW